MSEKLKIGELITTPQTRDAIHVAVAPVVAAVSLNPGEHVLLDAEGKAKYARSKRTPTIGVVDPFLRGSVNAGDMFWLFLYPGSITTLHHHWTHPAFINLNRSPEEIKKDESLAWLNNYAENVLSLTYDKMMEKAKAYLEYGAMHTDTALEGMSTPEEFWEHYEVITGTRPEGQYNSFFTCGGCG